MRRLNRNHLRSLTAVCLSAVIAGISILPVHAEEIQNAWDEETRVHVLRRRVATAINVYTDGTSDDITHEQGMVDGVIYDILRVNPNDHTFLQVDYTGTPGFVNELKDETRIEEGYQYAGGINAGYFSTADDNYGQPVGAVRRNDAWSTWQNEPCTPAYGNGFATAYIDGDDLELKYHGWKAGQWHPDQAWQWWTGYRIDADYAVSGSFTYFADGTPQDITNGDHGGINYRTFGRAVTILAQKENRQFLLITFYGTLAEDAIQQFLSDLDVYDAIRFDGGGSTQMVYDTDYVETIEPELSDTAFTEAEPERPIGYVTVHVDSLRVRRDSSTASGIRGTATNGERYQVYELDSDDTYTWYRIGEDRWIAGTDEWVTYEPIALIEEPSADVPASPSETPSKEDEPASPASENVMKVTVNVDNLRIRNQPGLDGTEKGKAVNGFTYTAYETVQAQGYTWYRIGEDSWIAGNPDWVTVSGN